eukprot:1195424-Prorocentrum_minimum.AAC.3
MKSDDGHHAGAAWKAGVVELVLDSMFSARVFILKGARGGRRACIFIIVRVRIVEKRITMSSQTWQDSWRCSPFLYPPWDFWCKTM